MKKLVNDPAQAASQALEALTMIHAGLARLEGTQVAVRSDLETWRRRGQVALISGGGSGHEPAHAGYVGEGLLTAAVCGDIFTSPSVDSVLTAIRACATPAGVLLIVKNYTGDRLNFGLAAEMAAAEGTPVRTVLVADDVALGDASGAGRRGLAGTLFVHKVAGAAAAEGLPLEEVHRAAVAAAQAVRTMGVALSPCTPPGAAASFELGTDEVELGLGIHGEPGVRRIPVASAAALVDRLLASILTDAPATSEAGVALLVNNLGGTSALEMAIVTADALRGLQRAGIRAERVWCGTYLTAIDMAGVSLSVMPLTAELTRRLDAPALAPAWSPGVTPLEAANVLPAPKVEAARPLATGAGGGLFSWLVAGAAESLRNAEGHLTELDRLAGDGDLGVSMRRGAGALLQRGPSLSDEAPAAGLRSLAGDLRAVLGGSSGPLYAAGLLRAAAGLGDQPTPRAWAGAIDQACAGLQAIGGAAPGDRTMLDALYPAAQAFRAVVEAGKPWIVALHAAATAAEGGAAATAALSPRFGRSSYLGDRVLGVPDPGAVAVAIWLRALHGAGAQSVATT